MDSDKKRCRGPNFTAADKDKLLAIIAQFSNIIENKKTDGQSVQTKKSCWMMVTEQYNSVAVTGPRSVEQLKSLYDNLKRFGRKQVAEKNKTKFLEDLGLTREAVEEAEEKRRQDTVQLKKTGGGVVKPQLDETGAQILALIHDQVEPLSNPFDSAAAFFGDEYSDILKPGPSGFSSHAAFPEPLPGPSELSTFRPRISSSPAQTPKRRPPVPSSPAPTPQRRPLVPSSIAPTPKRNPQKNKKLCALNKMGSEQLKRTYYKIKIKNALLHRQLMLKQDRLDTQIKQKTLSKL